MTNEPREPDTIMLSATEAERRRAHRAVQVAMAAGVIERQECDICGTCGSLIAHHPDYSEPLAVIWLCRTHHARVHAEMKRIEARLQHA